MKTPLIFIQPLTDGTLELLEFCRGVSEENNFELYEVESEMEIAQLLPVIGSSVIILADTKKCALVLKTSAKTIKANRSKLLLISPRQLPEDVMTKLNKAGVSEFLNEPIVTKKVFYKITLLLKAVAPAFEAAQATQTKSEFVTFKSTKEEGTISTQEKMRVEKGVIADENFSLKTHEVEKSKSGFNVVNSEEKMVHKEGKKLAMFEKEKVSENLRVEEKKGLSLFEESVTDDFTNIRNEVEDELLQNPKIKSEEIIDLKLDKKNPSLKKMDIFTGDTNSPALKSIGTVKLVDDQIIEETQKGKSEFILSDKEESESSSKTSIITLIEESSPKKKKQSQVEDSNDSMLIKSKEEDILSVELEEQNKLDYSDLVDNEIGSSTKKSNNAEVEETLVIKKKEEPTLVDAPNMKKKESVANVGDSENKSSKSKGATGSTENSGIKTGEKNLPDLVKKDESLIAKDTKDVAKEKVQVVKEHLNDSGTLPVLQKKMKDINIQSEGNLETEMSELQLEDSQNDENGQNALDLEKNKKEKTDEFSIETTKKKKKETPEDLKKSSKIVKGINEIELQKTKVKKVNQIKIAKTKKTKKELDLSVSKLPKKKWGEVTIDYEKIMREVDNPEKENEHVVLDDNLKDAEEKNDDLSLHKIYEPETNGIDTFIRAQKFYINRRDDSTLVSLFDFIKDEIGQKISLTNILYYLKTESGELISPDSMMTCPKELLTHRFPHWSDDTFQKTELSFYYPYFEDQSLLAIAAVNLAPTVKPIPELSQWLEVILEIARGEIRTKTISEKELVKLKKEQLRPALQDVALVTKTSEEKKKIGLKEKLKEKTKGFFGKIMSVIFGEKDTENE